MRRKLLVLLSLISVFSVLSVPMSVPAYADTFDLLPTRGLSCNMSLALTARPVAAGVHTMRADGSADCPGGAVTELTVCIQMRQPTGDYEGLEGACGSGASQNRAFASVEIICVPGSNYRAIAIATSGASIDKQAAGPVTCPKLSQ